MEFIEKENPKIIKSLEDQNRQLVMSKNWLQRLKVNVWGEGFILVPGDGSKCPIDESANGTEEMIYMDEDLTCNTYTQ